MERRAENIQIRRYEVHDLEKVRALHERMEPFRPDDQAAVQAMYARAAEAERTRDRWVPYSPAADSLEVIEASYLAFWVAVAAAGRDRDAVVGMVGVRRCGAEMTALCGLPIASEWQQRGTIVELRRLRVAPEHWRRGIGTRLSQSVIDWSYNNGFRSVVLNTTVAQVPALAMYRRLGFQEVGRSFAGIFELVWLELLL
jgi:ribosomal protein S18 acetylase RimI-like enzyme